MFQSPGKLIKRLVVTLAVTGSVGMANAQAADQEILNSSYDIARELFASYNELFTQHWLDETGKTVEIKQSHGGSRSRHRQSFRGCVRTWLLTTRLPTWTFSTSAGI